MSGRKEQMGTGVSEAFIASRKDCGSAVPESLTDLSGPILENDFGMKGLMSIVLFRNFLMTGF